MTRRIIVALVLLAQALSAASSSYNGGTGNWSNALNWNPNVSPNNGGTRYQVTVNSGVSNLTLDTNVSIDSLVLGATSGTSISTLNIGNQSLSLGGAPVIPVLTNNAKGVINVTGTGALVFDLSAGGSTASTSNGALNLNGGSLQFTGGTSNAFTLGGTGAITMTAGSITGSGAEVLTIAGPITGSGTISNFGSFRTTSSIGAGSAQTLNISSVGNLILEQACCNSNTINAAGGTVNVGGNVQFNGFYSGISVTGGGAVNIGGSMTATGSIFGSGIQVTGAGSSLISNGANFGGPVKVGAGASIDLRGAGGAGAWSQYNAATNTLAGTNLDVAGNLQFNGGPITTTSNSLTLRGSGALFYGPGAGASALTNLTNANGGLTLTDGAHLSISPNGGIFTSSVTLGTSNGAGDGSSLTVNGAFNGSASAYAGTTFAAQGGTSTGITAQGGSVVDLRGGTLTNYDAVTKTFTGANANFGAIGGTIRFDGGPIQTIAAGTTMSFGVNPTTLAAGAIEAWSGGVATDPFTALNTIAGRLDISSPTYTINPTGGTLTMQKVGSDPIFNIGSAVSTAASSIVTVNGAIVDGGRLTVNSGSTLYSQGLTNLNTPSGSNFGLTVASGALYDARGGAWGNLAADGTLTGGSYSLGGTLRYDGGDIKSMNVRMTIDTNGALLAGPGAGTQPFGTLTNIGAALSLNNGLAYNLTPDGGTLTLTNGAGLFLGGSGTKITVNGNMQLNTVASSTAIQISGVNDGLLVNGNLSGTGGINVSASGASFKVTGDLTTGAGSSFSAAGGNTLMSPFEIGGKVNNSAGMNIGQQVMHVGGDFNNLAGSFIVGGAFSDSINTGVLTVGGNLTSNATMLITASSQNFHQGTTTDLAGGLVSVTGNVSNTKTMSINGAGTQGNSAQMSVGGNYTNSGAGIVNVSSTSSARSNARLDVTGDFNNSGTGAVNINNRGIATVGGKFTNSGTGTVNVNAGGLLTDGLFDNFNNVNVNGNLAVTGAYTQYSGYTKVNAGGKLSAVDIVLQGGTMSGAGTYQGDVDVMGGTFAPGDPVTTTIIGDYTQSGGILSLVIASASSYDQLRIFGDMNVMGGILKITFLPSYNAHYGDLFHFFTLDGTFSGGFSSIQFVNKPLGFEFFNVPDSSGTFQLQAAPEPGTWMMMFAGALGLAAFRRRSSNRNR